jgi:hypothetical protein
VKSNKARPSPNTLRLWSFEDARAAVPYLTSVIRSLRESYLELLALRRQLQGLARRQGRPDRKTLIAEQETRRDLHRVEQEYQSALDELEALDVQPLDPSHGTALVPFVHEEQLAWYIFDLFDSEPLRSWRYQSDPDETRRKLTTAQMR